MKIINASVNVDVVNLGNKSGINKISLDGVSFEAQYENGNWGYVEVKELIEHGFSERNLKELCMDNLRERNNRIAKDVFSPESEKMRAESWLSLHA